MPDSFKLDVFDRKILHVLQSDGRITNVELAARIGLSPTACLRRTKTLEAEGVISGYVALLDARKAKKPIAVFVEIALTSQVRDAMRKFEDAVSRSPDIMECHLMAGKADYLLKIAVADPAEFESVHRDYLATLPGVSRIQSAFAIRTIVHRTSYALGGRS